MDSLLYVDTDVLFLRPVDDIWKLLRQFNSTQLAAMASEHEAPTVGWYSRFARHPFYGSAGVNSGVMLMNLTRIRSTQFKVRVLWGSLLKIGHWLFKSDTPGPPHADSGSVAGGLPVRLEVPRGKGLVRKVMGYLLVWGKPRWLWNV